MIVKEGSTKLEVPEIDEKKFPPSSSGIFFNPRMESNRDLSVASVRAVDVKKYFDAHSATGARAIRVANEVERDIEVVANDWSKSAIKYIEKNKRLNDVSVKISQKDARIALYDSKYDFIDLDPFGSPVPFLDAAVDSLLDEGYLALTATDTAPLCGSHIKAGLRRYGARTLRTPYHKEIGVRVLLGKTIRKGVEEDKALIPQLSYYDSHYFRVYCKNKEGAKSSNKLVEEIGVIQHCFGCGKREIRKGYLPILKERCSCGEKFRNAGPLFLGELHHRGFVEKILETIEDSSLKTKEKNMRLLKTCINEINLPPGFYDVHKVCKRLSVSAPRTKALLKELRSRGYNAVRTHFEPTGFKTNAGIKEINKVVSSLMPPSP